MSADRVREVCVVLLTGLGDVVHGLPVVNALKRAHPDWRITWVVEPMAAPVLSPHPSVDQVIVYRRSRGVAGVRELWRDMRGRRFDLTLNLNYLAKSIWPTLFSGAPRRVGFGRDRSPEWVWLAVNDHLPPRRRGHTQDMFLQFLDVLGVARPEPLEWRISITPEERTAQREFFAKFESRPVVSVVPASAMGRKDWLPGRYVEVVDALHHDFGAEVVLVGGHGERETRIAREIADRASLRPAWRLGYPLRDAIWTLDGSRLLVAPDTGPLHLARAMDVPVVGLYGHTNPWRVGPYGKFQDLWVDRYTNPGEAPDPSRTEPRLGRMETITTRDVLECVERALRPGLPDSVSF
ncbi:MAG: glycosyltransferase family 9 protein [Gemmatimonadetes bacterium]|nr:glycosyltransferase family 9 protein [Gemmatimonadota bacterium]